MTRLLTVYKSSVLPVAWAGALLASGPVLAQQISSLTSGDLIISTVSNSTGLSNNNALDTASPITLQELQLGPSATTATSIGTLTLPQLASGNNAAISGEYGSASEGILQQSVNGQYLTIMGYGVNANAFNTGGTSMYGTTALGQTTSLTGSAYVTVPRVVALIGGNGSVNTSTALTGVFNTNNPRSVATIDGSSFYVSGQGASEGDTTEGVFYATLGATTATAIDTSTDTRVVSIVNNGSGNALYVSSDVKVSGNNKNSTNISTLTSSGGGLPTSASGLVTTQVVAPATLNPLSGNNSSITVTAGTENGVNDPRLGNFVYLSPEQYFFASPSVLYVADSGSPKNGQTGAAAGLGEGGLQKWVLTNGTWTLDYDLVAGLNLVAGNGGANTPSPTSPGVTGLFGLTGKVVGNSVELFATSYGLNELSPSYLYEISDTLSDTTISQASSESFTVLDAAAAGTSIRGVAFAPVPLPGSVWLMLSGLCGLGLRARRRKLGPPFESPLRVPTFARLREPD
jgi:hypothetical protein